MGIKMIRKIVKIDNEKCNGCGACARACHEGAITFEERESPAYDHAAVLASKQKTGLFKSSLYR